MGKDSMNQENYFVYKNAVQDMTERIRMACATYAIGTDRKTGDLIYAHSDGTWHNLLNDITEQMLKSVQETREPVYGLYKNLDNKYTLRVILYSLEQISEFCCTAGKRIMSACGRNEMLERLEKYGFSAYSFDISKLDIRDIPLKYVSEKEQCKILSSEEVAMKNYWQLKKCLKEYTEFFPDFYKWDELGMNSKGELVYLHNSLGGGTLRCLMGSDGYPDILNDRGESVFDYVEEMEMSEEDVARIRGMESYSEEKEL